jgi:hypothetical protein
MMRDDILMRTTLDIDDEILRAAKELAAQSGLTAGKVLSELARQALKPSGPEIELRNGVPLLPPRPDARPVTLAAVNELRDET